jgi:hypothetical protein
MLALLLGTGPGQESKAEPKVAASPPKLAFLVEQRGGMTAMTGGVLLAGWTDGLMIFSLDPMRPDKIHQCGTIPPARIEWAVQELKSAGFFDEQQEPGGRPDTPDITITASFDGKATSHMSCQDWHCGYWAASADSDAKTYKFAKMWAISRTALAFTRSKDFHAVNTDEIAKKRIDGMTRDQVGKP